MPSTPTNGDDVIFGTDDDDFINALAGNDLVFGGLGDDTLFGGSGNDQLSAGLGLDFLYGGTGVDTALYSFAATSVIASLVSGYGYVQGPSTDKDTFSSIENLSGGAGGDTLTGDDVATSSTAMPATIAFLPMTAMTPSMAAQATISSVAVQAPTR